MDGNKKDCNEWKHGNKNAIAYSGKKELSLEELKKFAGGRTIIDGTYLDSKNFR